MGRSQTVTVATKLSSTVSVELFASTPAPAPTRRALCSRHPTSCQGCLAALAIPVAGTRRHVHRNDTVAADQDLLQLARTPLLLPQPADAVPTTMPTVHRISRCGARLIHALSSSLGLHGSIEVIIRTHHTDGLGVARLMPRMPTRNPIPRRTLTRPTERRVPWTGSGPCQFVRRGPVRPHLPRGRHVVLCPAHAHHVRLLDVPQNHIHPLVVRHQRPLGLPSLARNVARLDPNAAPALHGLVQEGKGTLSQAVHDLLKARLLTRCLAPVDPVTPRTLLLPLRLPARARRLCLPRVDLPRPALDGDNFANLVHDRKEALRELQPGLCDRLETGNS